MMLQLFLYFLLDDIYLWNGKAKNAEAPWDILYLMKRDMMHNYLVSGFNLDDQ